MSICVLSFASFVGLALGTTHTVELNKKPVWTVGVGLSYSDMTITLGKTISFTSSNMHDVVLLIPPSSGTPWDLCTMTGIAAGSKASVFANSDFGTTNTEKHFTPPTCGDYHLACSVAPHCAFGQRVKVTVTNVDGSACSSPCAGADCVTAASTQLVSVAQNVHPVSPVLPLRAWGVAFYDDMTVNIGDTVVFQTGAGFHDIASVSDMSAYSSCSTSNKVLHAAWDYSSGNVSSACASSTVCCPGNSCGKAGMYATYTYTATTAGDVYFICAVGAGSHCRLGQKFKLTVNADSTPNVASGARLAHVRWFACVFAIPSFFVSMV